MDRKLKVMQFGCGFTGTLILKDLIIHGADIVAAVDIMQEKVGKDVGELCGIGAIGRTVRDFAEAERLLERTAPDICIVATVAVLPGVKDIIELCVKHNCNVITTCEAAHYPWRQYPATAEQLDLLAKKHNVTVSASGVPDVTWGVVIADLAGAMGSLEKIEGVCCANLEGYHKEAALNFDATLPIETAENKYKKFNGLSSEEQVKIIQNGEYEPNYMWYQNDWLCEKIGLTPHVHKEEKKAVLCTHDFYSETFKRVIKTGEVVGNAAVVTTNTKEGITLETQFVTKLFAPDEPQTNSWRLIGDHEVSMAIKSSQELVMTAASIVNRIPYVVNSGPGFITTASFSGINYLVDSIEKYVK